MLFKFCLIVRLFSAFFFFFFSSRRRHTRCLSDWSSDVCSSDLGMRRRVHDAEAVGHADDDAAGTEERLATPESQRKAHASERDERVVRRAIEEGRRQADDDDVSGWCGPQDRKSVE